MNPDAAFSALIGRIYECALDASRWPNVLGEITDLFRCELGDVTVIDPLSGNIHIAAMHNWTDELLQRVRANMKINPTAALVFAAPLGEPMCTSRDLDIVAFHNSRYWRACFEGTGYYDYLTTPFSRTATSAGVWGVLGTERRGPFNDDDIELARMLSPHIRRSVEISGVLGHQRVLVDNLHAALDQLTSAALIIGGNREILFANAQAGRELSRGTLFREDGGRLVGVTAESVKLLADSATIKAGHQRGRDARLQDAQGRIAYANWVYLHRSADARGQCLIMLREPDLELVTPITTAAATFKLTASEVQVLGQVLQGQTLVEVAGVLGIARSTVKTHLDAIYNKTNTRRQAELVRLVVGLSSPFQ
jgi:DNA-binding CsgD family transcriptional regulator